MFPPQSEGGRARTASTSFFDTVVQEDLEPEPGTETPLAEEQNRVFYKLAVWKRVVVMLGGPFMNLVIAIALYAVLLSGFGVYQASTTVDTVSACVIPATSTQTECTDADPVAPGVTAGIKPGDRIVSMNGAAVESWDKATELIRESPGTPLELVVERDGVEKTLTATPLLNERYVYGDDGAIVKDAAGDPVTTEVGFLGISSLLVREQLPLTAVLPAVGDNVSRVGAIIINLPQKLYQVAQAAFGSEERDPNGPVSVVGVGRIAGELASTESIPVVDRIAGLVGIIASLNVALLVFNLIPLMPLDGGHVAIALWDGVRRTFAKLLKRPAPGPVDAAKLVPITLAVVAVLGVMTVLLVYADIVKPITLQ
jgi:membrane-associated protease RseP (regulator of RpoE activity)